MVITLNMIQTLAAAVIVLLVGRWLCGKVGFLNKFCIPAPVVGGLLFSIIILIGHQTGMFSFDMDMTLKDFFMTFFFTTVGFSASFKMLKKGGLQVLVFLAAAVILVVFQDIVGVGLAKVFSLHPLIGLSTGSVPMTGGHGTSAAFAPVFEELGATGATTVALAAATFGLIMGSMVGGPIARTLIEKRGLVAKAKEAALHQEDGYVAFDESTGDLKPHRVLNAFFLVAIAMGLGTLVSALLNKTPLTFPGYIGAMLVAAVIRNIGDASGGKLEVCMDEIGTLGDLFLTIFLAMALMSLKLWELAGLAGPLVVMLGAQTVLMVLFAVFVTFRMMGSDYDAAVITSGHCGFGMGATPNAMANMKAITEKYIPSPKAFFVLPIVGSLFIDFFNSFIITVFMSIFS